MEKGKQQISAPAQHPDEAQPRDAATLILVDRTGPQGLRVLMGRRRGDQIFLPGTYVFPGGRIDPADALAPSHGALHADDLALLSDQVARVDPGLGRALALAAIRETYEETGLLVGVTRGRDVQSSLEEESLAAPWRRFLGEGVVPSLEGLRLLARALTPPGRPRRYDTRFFIAEASVVAKATGDLDGELEDIGWRALDAALELPLPPITRVILKDVSALIDEVGPAPLAFQRRSAGVPYYSYGEGGFRRVLLSRRGDPGMP